VYAGAHCTSVKRAVSVGVDIECRDSGNPARSRLRGSWPGVPSPTLPRHIIITAADAMDASPPTNNLKQMNLCTKLHMPEIRAY